MPRKLKTYQTSQGFFDLAVAAPSMKAALEAWGARRNLFREGFAKESDDSHVIAATMAIVTDRNLKAAIPKAFNADVDLAS